MDVRVNYKESWALKNWCFWTVVPEKTLECSLDCKQILFRTDLKDWCWSWNSNTLATWCEEPTPWKKFWCWERLKAGGERDNRGKDDWMASRTKWIWVWVGFGSWWWTGNPGVLQSMWLQSQTWLSDWTELNWSFYKYFIMYIQLRCMES